jgi:hypothetical protein
MPKRTSLSKKGKEMEAMANEVGKSWRRRRIV